MPDAPRPPFDRLDAMTPPDQWADVGARLDDAPLTGGPDEADTSARSTTRRWVLAAAALAFLAATTGVVLGRDDTSTTTTDGGAAEGCPFTFLPSADDLLQPSTGELMLVAGAAPGSDSRGQAVQHAVVEGAVVGDRTIEVDVVTGGDEPLPDPSMERIGATTWLDLHAPVGQPRPGCDLIRVRIDVSRFTEGTPDDDRSLDGLAEDFAHLADSVANVLALVPLDPELADDEPCSFTLDGDPTLGPLTPMRPGDADPFEARLFDHVVDEWQRVEVDGSLALVGVGGYGTGPMSGPVGDRWIDGGPSGSTGAAKMMATGYLSVAASGWCTDAVVHLIIPLTSQQVAAAEAGQAESEWFDLEAAQATIGRVMDALRVEP